MIKSPFPVTKLTTGFPCTLFYRVFANLARTFGITFANFVLVPMVGLDMALQVCYNIMYLNKKYWKQGG